MSTRDDNVVATEERWKPVTVEDYKAMYKAKNFLFERQREAMLRLMLENAAFRKLFDWMIDFFELDE